jgi:ribonucleoside-diphosphate reductase alpha chain
MRVLLKDLLTTYKLGIKTLYYHNTRDGATDNTDKAFVEEASSKPAQEVIIEEDDDCAGGACKI